MYTIGIDLGGTNIVASVVDDEYKIIGTSKTPTNAPRSADEILMILPRFAKKQLRQQT